MAETWRLLLTGARPGADNMALDEAVFRAVDRGESPPTVRFYSWEPACVSLGRLQRDDSVDAQLLEQRGIDLVRRPTGGRAILHDDEVTYSVAAPIALCPMGTDVMSTYRWVSSGLIDGLAQLGVRASLAQRAGRSRKQPACRLGTRGVSCFASAAQCDLVVDEKKLIGSAQARASDAFLQHGSLPVFLNRELLERVLGSGGDPGENATDLSELIGQVDHDSLMHSLAAGMESALDIRLRQGELSPQEREAATELAKHKYGRLW